MRPQYSKNQLEIEHDDHALFETIGSSYTRKDTLASSRIARTYRLWSGMEPILAKYGKIGTLVDVGCGVGAPARFLHGYYERYIGIDYSGRFLEAARTFHTDNPHAMFLENNITSIELPPNTADVVLAIGVLHHVADLPGALMAIRKIAKPGAHFVAIEPNRKNMIIQLARRMRRMLDPHYSSDQRQFSARELRGVLMDTGMRDVELRFQGFVSTPFAEVPVPPQLLMAPLSRLAVLIDRFLGRILPRWAQSLAWNIIVIARFP